MKAVLYMCVGISYGAVYSFAVLHCIFDKLNLHS